MTVTFMLVVIGWIIFRADSMSQATGFLLSIYSNPFLAPSALYGIKEVMLCFLFLAIEWLRREDPFVLHLQWVRPKPVKWLICIAVAVFSYLYMADNIGSFIYFQF